MRNVIHWSLFGEIIDEVLDLDNLPEYISGNLEKDVKTFRKIKQETIEQENFTVSDLVQEVYFVVSLSEIDNFEDDKKNSNDEKCLFREISESEAQKKLFEADKLNRTLMDVFYIGCYEIKYKLNEIENKTESLAEKEAVQRYFNTVADILHGNTTDIPIDRLKEIRSEDVVLSDLMDKINRVVQDGSLYMGAVVEAVGEWFEADDIESTKYGLKRRLLKRVFEREYDHYYQYYRYILEYEHDVASFLVRFVQDDGYLGIINEQINILNDEVIYLQNRMLNITFIKSKSFIKDTLLELLKRELQKYDELKPYVIGKRCFALMKIKSSANTSSSNIPSYFSISGLDKEKKELIKACKDVERILQRKNCIRIKLNFNTDDDKVRYHINSKTSHFLSYADYCRYYEYLKNTGNLQVLQSNGRMFSCCERKLFSRLSKKEYYVIYVSQTSCYMCKNAATYIRNTQDYKFHVIYGKRYNRCSKGKMYNYDKKADKDRTAIQKLKKKGIW